jgi:predicted RNA-binding protein YlqC (UPF0109 family)|tara:strand:+ start:190 stop:435 length:246 start_codon:yes stop_codon:yes gene_type:complete
MENKMQKLLEDIVKSIVDKPDEVQVNVNESENTIVYELNVGDGDLGKVIGKKGKNVNSIRTLLSASNAKEGGKRAILEIIE